MIHMTAAPTGSMSTRFAAAMSMAALRMPVEYSSIRIVRCIRLCAAAITCATSSRLRICGNRRGTFGYGVSSTT